MENEKESIEALVHLRDTIQNVRIAMLTTQDADGSLRSRPMAVQDTDFDGDLWFFTSDDSEKADSLKGGSAVNVAFVDVKANRYVSVSGVGELMRDHAKILELWNPAFGVYFPEGLKDPHLALIRVETKNVTWWDGPTSLVGKVVGFVKALVTRKPSEMGDTGTAKV
jgi:general stress protein 26